MRSYTRSIIAIVAIAVSAYTQSANAQSPCPKHDARLSGSERMAAKRAREGKVATVDKEHDGGLFGAFGYFKGVIPDDVYVLEDVGVRCNESGAPNECSPARCRRFKSDSANTTFVVRLTRAEHLTFYYENEGGKQILVPYTRYNNGTYQMSFMSDKAEQFASAHGLAIKDTTASISQTEVVATATKCDNLFEPLKTACLGVLAADQKPVKMGPAVGGIIEATKK